LPQLSDRFTCNVFLTSVLNAEFYTKRWYRKDIFQLLWNSSSNSSDGEELLVIVTMLIQACRNSPDRTIFYAKIEVYAAHERIYYAIFA
jgi:hypothetical protein